MYQLKSQNSKASQTKPMPVCSLLAINSLECKYDQSMYAFDTSGVWFCEEVPLNLILQLIHSKSYICIGEPINLKFVQPFLLVRRHTESLF